MRECAATFGWSLSGNCLACSKGYLSFLLLPTMDDDRIDYSLSYRYSSFDRVYHALTSANLYPGTKVAESSQPVDSWGLMSVSTAMRTLTSRTDRFAAALAEKIISLEDNLDFLRYLHAKSVREFEPPLDYSSELIFTCLLKGDFDAAVKTAAAARKNGDSGGELYASVVSYAGRHGGSADSQTAY